MVQFARKLRNEARSEWQRHYIDYDLLKRKLGEIREAAASDSEALVKARRQIFQGTLDEELSQALDFFKRTSCELKARTNATLEGIAAKRQELAAASPELKLRGIGDGVQQLQALSEEITQLLNFVSLNMAAVRKILKKLKKHIAPMESLPGFLTLEIEHPHDPSFKMSEGTFLPESKAADLEEMNKHDDVNQCAADIIETHRALKAEQFEILMAVGEDERSGMRRLIPHASSSDMDACVSQLLEAQALSRRNANLVHTLHWSEAHAGIFSKPPADEGAATATTLGLFLVCAASTLYMANYQLVLPTITSFCTHLGVPASYAGYVVGATDVAAIPVTIVYSYWTNYAFKRPFTFAAGACIVSNILYCLSYDHGGFLLLAFARFLTGLGSSRSVSRRYIADFTPTNRRTQASTAFVCSSAIGMALGPLLSFPLQQLGDSVWYGVRINPITAAAILMAAAWLAFGIVCEFFFEDPLQASRSGDAPTLTQPLLRPEGKLDGAISRMEEALPRKEVAATDKETEQQAEEARSGLRSALAPTAVAIAVLWMLKMVQQAYMDGLSLFTFMLFDWGPGDVGLLLTALGLSAVPVSATVGMLSSKVPDRYILSGTVAAATVGCLMLAFRCDSALGYFGGGALVFLGTLVLEGAGMSLLSKVIHPSMKQGLFNAGLLATEAGTLGRLAGNAAISAIGHITGTETTQQLLQYAKLMYLFDIAILAAVQTSVLVLWQSFIV